MTDVATDEAGIPASHKKAILCASEDDVAVTSSITGRPARGIRNRLMESMDTIADATLPFSAQNSITRPLRAAAAALDRPEYLALWAGQGVRMARPADAAEITRAIVEDADVILAGKQRLGRRREPTE